LINVLEYAFLLDCIGMNIEKASEDLIRDLPLKGDIDLGKINLQKLKIAYKEYMECRNKMVLVIAPIIIIKEHKQLIDAFDDFLEGIRIMLNGFSLEGMLIDEQKIFQIGYTKQFIGEVRTRDVVNEIVAKLIT
jgi:hypothetical protein